MRSFAMLTLALAFLAAPAWAESVIEEAQKMARSGTSQQELTAWAAQQKNFVLLPGDVTKMTEAGVPHSAIQALIQNQSPHTSEGTAGSSQNTVVTEQYVESPTYVSPTYVYDGGPVYYSDPYYYGPSVGLGFYFGGSRYYGHHHHGGGHYYGGGRGGYRDSSFRGSSGYRGGSSFRGGGFRSGGGGGRRR